jgi:uncharacterized protein YaaW (UPF0174 family)
MHHDLVVLKVEEAQQQLLEHVLTNPGENGSSGELQTLVDGVRGPGVQEVLTAKALAELARQVAELTERVRDLEDTKTTKRKDK